MSSVVLVEAHVGEELARAVVAERGVGERVAGLGARAGLDLVGVDRDGAGGDPRRAGDHPLPAVLDRLDPRPLLVERRGAAGRACSPGTARRPPGSRRRPRRARRSRDRSCGCPRSGPAPRGSATSSGSSAARGGTATWTPPSLLILCSAHGGHRALRGRQAVSRRSRSTGPSACNAITPELDRRPREAPANAPRTTPRSARSGCAAPAGRSAPATTSAGARSRWRRPRATGPWDPIADYAMMSRFVDAYMAPVALAQAGHRPGPRLLRRRRHRLRAVLGPHRLRRGRPHRLPAGARLGLADDRDVDLPARARALQAPAAHRRRRSTAAARSSGGWPPRPSRRTSSTPPRWRSPSASRGCPPTSCT